MKELVLVWVLVLNCIAQAACVIYLTVNDALGPVSAAVLLMATGSSATYGMWTVCSDTLADAKRYRAQRGNAAGEP